MCNNLKHLLLVGIVAFSFVRCATEKESSDAALNVVGESGAIQTQGLPVKTRVCVDQGFVATDYEVLGMLVVGSDDAVDIEKFSGPLDTSTGTPLRNLNWRAEILRNGQVIFTYEDDHAYSYYDTARNIPDDSKLQFNISGKLTIGALSDGEKLTLRLVNSVTAVVWFQTLFLLKNLALTCFGTDDDTKWDTPSGYIPF